MYKGNKFKNSVGAHLLQALFYEMAVGTDRNDVLYTLKLEDTYDVNDPSKLYLSLHRLYVEMEDTSEYEFAKKYFDNWTHWKKLLECNWFKPYLAEMREELDVKLRARALNQIRDVAANTLDKNHFSANRLILDKGLAVKTDNRGRPSKEKIKAEADRMFQIKEEIDDDFSRISGQLNG